MTRKKAKRKNIIRATRRQSVPVATPASQWDHGADGPANRIGLVVEERGELDPATGKMVNPNRVTGARRLTWLERYAAKGWISPEGLSAGLRLHLAWQRISIGTSAPWLRERVDATPRPDHAVTVQIDRREAYHRIWRTVPAEDRRVLHWVCCENRSLGAAMRRRGGRGHDALKANLREALDRLARAA